MKSLLLATFTIFFACSFEAEAKGARSPDSAPKEVVVKDCDADSPTSLENYAERRTFGNESVKVFVADSGGEPVCCHMHLVIYFPKKGDEGENKCVHVLADKEMGLGFADIGLKNAKASYSADNGLSIDIPFYFYTERGSVSRKFKVQINQATQRVKVVR